MSLEKYENNTIYASVESEKIEIFDKEEIENSVNDDKDDEIAPYYIDQPDPPKV